MKIIILKHSAHNFFIKSATAEKEAPEGNWRYFKFISENEILGIYENNHIGTEIHTDFFKYFLGQFTPKMHTDISISQCSDFATFCIRLNNLLKTNIEIFDISVTKFWIWHKQEIETETVQSNHSLPSKLKDYLSF